MELQQTRIPMDPFSEIGLFAETKHYPKTDFTQMEFKGPLDVGALCEAYEEAVSMVPIFNSNLVFGRDGLQFIPYWQVNRDKKNTLHYQDCRHIAKEPFDPMEFLDIVHGERMRRSIDLSEEFPFKGFLFHIFDDRYIFSIRYQHSAMDPLKGYYVFSAMLAKYHEKVKGQRPAWADALGMASFGHKPKHGKNKVPKKIRNYFVVERASDIAKRYLEQGKITPIESEKVLPFKEAIGRHSLRFIFDDPKIIEGFAARAAASNTRVNDLLLTVMQRQLSEWNRDRGVDRSCFRLMLVSSLKGRMELAQDVGAGISGISFVTGGIGQLDFDEMMQWFGRRRIELLKEKFDVRFNKWASLYIQNTRMLPFAVRRRIWRQVLKRIHLSVYLSNLGVMFPKIVDGRPTLDSAVLGAGDFVISDIHSSPSIGPNVGMGVTIRTHNRRMYVNLVCDRYRFRTEEARQLVAQIESGLLNAI